MAGIGGIATEGDEARIANLAFAAPAVIRGMFVGKIYGTDGMTTEAGRIKAISRERAGGRSYIDKGDILVGMAGMNGVGFAFDLDSSRAGDNMSGGYYPFMSVVVMDIAATLTIRNLYLDARINMDGVADARVTCCLGEGGGGGATDLGGGWNLGGES